MCSSADTIEEGKRLILSPKKELKLKWMYNISDVFIDSYKKLHLGTLTCIIMDELLSIENNALTKKEVGEKIISSINRSIIFNYLVYSYYNYMIININLSIITPEIENYFRRQAIIYAVQNTWTTYNFFIKTSKYSIKEEDKI